MKPDFRILGMIALCCFGCASPEVYTSENAPEFMTNRKSSFFIRGPQQPGAPEELPPQTFFRLMRKEPGYSVVQLGDGRSGYIANEDIRLAPPSGRSVSDEELFPEKYVRARYVEPEPDFSMPVQEIAAPSPTPAKKP